MIGITFAAFTGCQTYNLFHFLNVAQTASSESAFYFADVCKHIYEEFNADQRWMQLHVLFTIRGLEMSIGIDVQGNVWEP